MSTTSDVNISIIYYSMYGHVKLMADAVKKGVEKAGAKCTIYRVAETLPVDVLAKMGADKCTHNEGIPEIDRTNFHEADGFIFGVPTRYGSAPAQIRAFLDSTGQQWQTGALVGKPAGTFFSTATLAGGQETTAQSMLSYFAHQGMVWIPNGYTFPKLQFDNSVVHGGSPYGPGTIANGDGSRLPSEAELEWAEHYGSHFAKLAIALKKGKAGSA